MSYVSGLTHTKRRPSVKHVTPEQLLLEANALVDATNDKIAKALAHAATWQQVAAEYHAENERLLRELTEARATIARLEKKLSTKAGKNKRKWEDEV